MSRRRQHSISCGSDQPIGYARIGYEVESPYDDEGEGDEEEEEEEEEKEMSFSHETLLLLPPRETSSSQPSEKRNISSLTMTNTSSNLLRRMNRMSIRRQQEEVMQRWFDKLREWVHESHVVTRGDYNSTSRNPSAWKQAYSSIRENSGRSNKHKKKKNGGSNRNSTNFRGSTGGLFGATTRTLHSIPAHHGGGNELPNLDNVFPMGVKSTYGLKRALEGLGKVCATADHTQRMGRKGRASELIMEKAAGIKGLLKTILMIEEDSDRKEICDMPFVKLMFLATTGIDTTEQYLEGEDSLATAVMSSRMTSRFGTTLPGEGGDEKTIDDHDRESPTYPEYGHDHDHGDGDEMMNDDTSIMAPSVSMRSNNNSSSNGNRKKRKKKIKCWFIEMLKSPSEVVNSRAVHYLESISSINFRDYVECHESINNRYGGNDSFDHRRRRSAPSSEEDSALDAILTHYDEDYFYAHLEELFSKIEHMKHLTALLVALPLDDIERVSTTAVIQWILQRRVRSPENVLVYFLDFGFQLCLLYTFRAQMLLGYTPGSPLQIDALNESPGGRLSTFFFLRSLTFTSVAYFMLRHVEVYTSMVSVSGKVCRKFFRQTGMWLDIFVNFFTILVNLHFILMPREEILEGPVLGMGCLALGLLWTRLFAFLQVMNRKLATYYLALVQIFSDIKLFMLVIVLTTLLFGDLYYIAYSSDKSVCDPASISSGLGTFDNDPDTNPNCSSPIMSALSIYGLFVGSYNFEDFNKGVWTYILYGPMTFFIILVMVNVLIAIVDESYEHSLLKSNRLFGRTRLFRISQSDAMADFAHTVTKGSPNRSTRRSLFLRVFVVGLLFCYMATLFSVLATCGVGLCTLIHDRVTRAVVVSLYGIYIVFVLVSVCLFSIDRVWLGTLQDDDPLAPRRWRRGQGRYSKERLTVWQRWTYRSFLFQNTVALPVQLFTLTLMGARAPPSIRSLLSNESKWRGRLGHTDQVIRATMQQVEHGMKTSVEELARRMRDSERRFERKLEERETAFRKLMEETNAKHEAALSAILNSMAAGADRRSTPAGEGGGGGVGRRSQPDDGLQPVDLSVRSIR